MKSAYRKLLHDAQCAGVTATSANRSRFTNAPR